MMEKKPTRRRKSKKPTVDDHYKVLGLRSNSRQERVKEKYIELVKQYPPEQHPEEFEKIRRAYEVLRDPVERKKYNLMRKHGSSIEDMLQEVFFYAEQENWSQAEELFLTILTIDPNLVNAQLGLANVYLAQDDLQQFNERMQITYEATDEDEKRHLLMLKAKFLIDADYPEEALGVLNWASSQHAEHKGEFRALTIQAYLALERDQEALRLIDQETAAIKEYRLDHLNLYMIWVNIMVALEKWELTTNIQKRFRKFLQFMSNEEEETKQFIVDELVNEYEGYYEEGYLRAATFYIDLIEGFSPKHPVVIENKKNLQEWDRVQREIFRMARDEQTFPLIVTKAARLFADETGIGGIAIELGEQMFPLEFIRQFEMMEAEYAAGIKYIQKKYPLIYRRYKKQWDQLFEEKTAGLNREERRRLR